MHGSFFNPSFPWPPFVCIIINMVSYKTSLISHISYIYTHGWRGLTCTCNRIIYLLCEKSKTKRSLKRGNKQTNPANATQLGRKRVVKVIRRWNKKWWVGNGISFWKSWRVIRYWTKTETVLRITKIAYPFTCVCMWFITCNAPFFYPLFLFPSLSL